MGERFAGKSTPSGRKRGEGTKSTASVSARKGTRAGMKASTPQGTFVTPGSGLPMGLMTPCASQCPRELEKVTSTLKVVRWIPKCNRPCGHEGPHRHTTGRAMVLAEWPNRFSEGAA